MRSKLFVTFLSIVFIITASCGNKKSGVANESASQEEIKLQLNLTKGKKYDKTMTSQSTFETNIMGNVINSTIETKWKMDYEVIDVTSSGNYIIRSTYRDIQIKNDRPDYVLNSSKKAFDAYIGGYNEIEIDKNRKILKSIDKKPEGIESGNDLEYLYNIFLPSEKIKVGNSWEANIMPVNNEGLGLAAQMNYTLISVNHGIAEIDMNGTLEMKSGALEKNITGTLKGMCKIEIATGLSKETVLDQEMNIEFNANGIKTKTKQKDKIIILIQ